MNCLQLLLVLRLSYCTTYADTIVCGLFFCRDHVDPFFFNKAFVVLCGIFTMYHDTCGRNTFFSTQVQLLVC